MDKSNGLSANDYEAATLSKLYLTFIGITMHSFKLIGHFSHF